MASRLLNKYSHLTSPLGLLELEDVQLVLAPTNLTILNLTTRFACLYWGVPSRREHVG